MGQSSRGFRAILAVCLAVVGVGLWTQTAWAYKGVAYIAGPVELIEGDSTAKGTEKAIELLGIGLAMENAVEPITRSTTGRIIVAPFRIVKGPDRATAKLLKALFANEPLTVEIRLFRPDRLGVPVLYHVITLGPGATIQHFTTGGDPNVAGGIVENVDFTYPSAKFEDKLTGTVAIIGSTDGSK